MPDKNTVWLEKNNDGETIIISFTVNSVRVDPIVTHQENIHCHASDYDFKEKIKSLGAGEKSSHIFPVPVRFERLLSGKTSPGSWRVVRTE